MSELTEKQIAHHKWKAEGVHPFTKMEIEAQDLRALCDMALRSLEEQRSASSAPAKPACYGIVNKDGEMFMDEACVSSDAGSLEDMAEHLRENEPDDGWRVAPMHFDAAPTAAAGAGKEGERG